MDFYERPLQNWYPGQLGKGFVRADGTMTAWKLYRDGDSPMEPHHADHPEATRPDNIGAIMLFPNGAAAIEYRMNGADTESIRRAMRANDLDPDRDPPKRWFENYMRRFAEAALREAWDESKVYRARTKPGTNRGSFAPESAALAAAAADFAAYAARTPEQRAAALAARRAARDAFEADVIAAGYKRRDRVRLKDRPGDFELFDYRHFDGKGVITVVPETAWGTPHETIDTTLDNIAGHSTSPNPAHLRNPFTKVHPQYKGPMIVEGYHNGSYEGIAGVRREGFDFSKHKRGTWGVGAYLFTGWPGKGFNPGGPGEDSVPLRATVKNALVVKLDNVGALDGKDPGQAEFDRITRAAQARTIHEERAAMLAAGYDGLLVLKWTDDPYLMVAYNPAETVTVLGENAVSSVSGIIAVGDEPPRPGDYNYRAGADTLANRGLLEATVLGPATVEGLEQREWPDDEPSMGWPPR